MNNPDVGQFARHLLEGDGYQVPKKGKNNDNAHPPIHPTKLVTDLSGEEKAVYELVVRHFLACCSKDAVGDQTNVSVSIGNESFSATGLVIRQLNFLNVYKYEKWSGSILPPFVQGQEFIPDSLEMVRGSTSPPSPLTEDELIGMMYKNGIGTDATIPTHIDTILKRV
jgi:DNA topoisomerase-3